MLEYARIPNPYDMDGLSWKSAVEGIGNSYQSWLDNRCLMFELGFDRAVRCGCDKYVYMPDATNSTTAMIGSMRGLETGEEVLFNLCDGNGDYIDAASGGSNPEASLVNDATKLAEMRSIVDCHLAKTHPDEDPDYFKQCDATPSASPTDAPSVTPTTSQVPTTSQQPSSNQPSVSPSESNTPTTSCIDSTTWTFTTNNGVTQGCSTVAQNPSNRCSRVGDDGRSALDACPNSCNQACASP